MVTYEDYATNNVYRFLTNNMEYEAITISEIYRKRSNVGRFLTDKTHLNELFNKAVPKEEPEDLWYPSLFKPDDF